MEEPSMRTLPRLRAVVAVVSMALCAAVAVPGGVANAESNGGVRVMPLGDSITYGTGDPGGYRIGLWQRLVGGAYTVDFVGSQSNGPAGLGDHDHEGHPGWTIAQIDANVVNWLTTYNPHSILLHIGTNDMTGNPAGAADRLATLLDHITTTAPNAEVFVAQIIPLGWTSADLLNFNNAIPGIVQTRVAAGKHLHVVDMYHALTTADLSSDGVHPTAAGYDKMSATWYNALRSVPGSIGNAASANLLTNGDIESGTGGWSVLGSGTLATSASVVHGGANSLLLSGRTAAWNGPSQDLTSKLINNRSYTTRVWMRTQSGTPTGKMTLALTAGGTTNYVTLAQGAVTSSGWTLLTGAATVSWTGVLSSARFYAETISGTDSFFIDDASVQ
jgi:lysophospholipase L1-like esterase